MAVWFTYIKGPYYLDAAGAYSLKCDLVGTVEFYYGGSEGSDAAIVT